MPLLEQIFGLLAPHSCLSCGREGALLCQTCQLDACPEMPDTCYRCHKLSADSKVCTNCRRSSPLSHVWQRTTYDDIVKEVIHRYKFERAQGAVTVVADLLDDVLPFLPDDVVITYVPTVTSHIRARGYDHARLLARAVAKKRRRQIFPLLARTGQLRQVGANRQQRLFQLDGVFRPVSEHLISGKTILLIDDIITTGSTLEAAANALKQAGAKRVYGAVLARAQ